MNRQAGGLDRLHVAVGHHPGVRDHGDVGQPVQRGELLDDRDDGRRLGVVPLESVDQQREPGRVGEQTDGDLRLQAAFLGEPGLTVSVSKNSVVTS
jgi:hypothetical protein